LTTKKSLHKTSSSVWPFFVLTYIWSWFFWISTIFLNTDVHDFITQIGIGLGGLGPAIFGVFFTYKNSNKKEFRDYLHRIWDWKNLSLFWWGIILFLIPVLAWIAGEIDLLSSGQGLKLDFQVFHFNDPLPLILAIPITVVFFLWFPIFEELGWRGYALDHLQNKMGPWAGSLLLGLFWGLWHLPLLFILTRESIQRTFSFDTSGLEFFLAALIVVSPIMTWIYNHTKRSIFSAILFHFVWYMSVGNTICSNSVRFFWILLCLLWIFFMSVLGKDWLLGYSKSKKRHNYRQNS
jgi:uncharacterized protein